MKSFLYRSKTIDCENDKLVLVFDKGCQHLSILKNIIKYNCITKTYVCYCRCFVPHKAVWP